MGGNIESGQLDIDCHDSRRRADGESQKANPKKLEGDRSANGVPSANSQRWSTDDA